MILNARVYIELTSSFVPSEQQQVVFHSRWIVGECELQLELVEEAEARDGGISREGSVTKLITSTESGTSYIDGCKTNTLRTRLFHIRIAIAWAGVCRVLRLCGLSWTGWIHHLPHRLPKDGTIATHNTSWSSGISFSVNAIRWWPVFKQYPLFSPFVFALVAA